jgi:hypothetical protein
MAGGIFKGKPYPLWFDHIISTSLAAADFDPIAQFPAGSKLLGHYTSNGFGLKNATETAGFIRAITLYQYEMNNKSLTGIIPTTINLNGGDWALTPLIKVFAANHATYPSTGMTTINVGWITT